MCGRILVDVLLVLGSRARRQVSDRGRPEHLADGTAPYPGDVADIEVVTYWDGKLRVFRLPDGTEIRKSKGDGQQPFEIVSAFLRDERELFDFNLSFREISAPPKTARRR
jgi:hypothetical protein